MLAGLPLTILHIGSTAIAGLVAKPIIDMLLVVRSLLALDHHAAKLGGLGFEAMGEFGIEGRRYFRKHMAAGVRSHHLHAFEAGSPQVQRHLAFRDHLIAHPSAAEAYGALKQSLAQGFPQGGVAYVDGKTTFIQAQLAQALARRG